jgi:hypothetical protein
MINWYSEYLLSLARQREAACAAESRRRLAESRDRRQSQGQGRGAPPLGPLVYRLGSALILIGRFLQRPSASGR